MKKILIVDDSSGFDEMLKANLELDGEYEVKFLLDAKHIVSEVKEFRPDIILLDLLMPSIGGIEACEILNKEPTINGIPIIILSGLDKKIDMLKAYNVGIVDYIVKPVEIKKLLVKINKALGYKDI